MPFRVVGRYRFQSIFLIVVVVYCSSSARRKGHGVVVHGLSPPSPSSFSSKSRNNNNNNPIRSITSDITVGYRQRCAADSRFPYKSIMEIFLAASTQFTAELQKRGTKQIFGPQIDFVIPAILTAVFGKYMSMWKTAPTASVVVVVAELSETTTQQSAEKKRRNRIFKNKKKSSSTRNMDDPKLFNTGMSVPTNAFQPYMLDGITKPKLIQRCGSFLVPMIPLFRAGCVASFLGYGFTNILIYIRSHLKPNYVPMTQTVPIIGATIFTGCFMAIVSNIRYQILQGLIEPFVDSLFANANDNKFLRFVHAVSLFLIRMSNGFLGSMISITGMQYFGLQKMK